jgi:SRSO17 transposase
MTLKISNIFG